MRTTALLSARIVDLVLLAILVGLAGILTAAMALQYVGGEVPCPLCLLQRVAIFGVCFGIIHHFRRGYDVRNLGVALVSALALLVVSARQVLINVVARPGHAYPGSAVLGLHMPVWSVIIALVVLAVLATTLTAVDGARLSATRPSPLLGWGGKALGLFVVALCAINFVSVVLQCGLGACHTAGYALL